MIAMISRLRSVAVAACLALAALDGHAAQARDDSLITLGAGVFDIRVNQPQEVEGRLEYRASYGLFQPDDSAFRGLKPLFGIMGNSAGGVFGYAGFAAPFWFFDEKWEIVPSAGVGAYRRGKGIDLGGTFEFHLGLGVDYAITRHNRIGIALNHISNATINGKNPGVNSVLLTWSFGFKGF